MRLLLSECNELHVFPDSTVEALTGNPTSATLYLTYNGGDEIEKDVLADAESVCTALIEDAGLGAGYILRGLVTSITVTSGSTTYTWTPLLVLGMSYLNLQSVDHRALFVEDFETWLQGLFGEQVVVTLETSGTADVIDGPDDQELTFYDLLLTVTGLPIGHSLGTITLQKLNVTIWPTDTETIDYSVIGTCSNDKYILTPTDYAQTGDNFTHGVYCVRLEVVTEDSRTLIERKAKFVDCAELICLVASQITNCPDSTVHVDYFILSNMGACKCGCEGMNELYNKIMAQLTDSPCVKDCTDC